MPFVGRACKLNYTLFLRETRLAFIGMRFFVFISKSEVYSLQNAKYIRKRIFNFWISIVII